MSTRTRFLMVFLVLGMLGLPQLSQAQDGTLQDCLDAAYVAYGIVDSEATTGGRVVTCQSTGGKALVSFRGQQIANSSEFIAANLRFLRHRSVKACSIKLAHQGELQQEIAYYTLRGKDASAWNRALKGTLCDAAMVLANP